MEIKDQIALMRVKIRAFIAIAFSATLCASVFLISDFREFLLGTLAGSLGTVLVFYFKKSEENGGME